MTTVDAFLQDIIDHSEDDTPRLIFADWLTDQGQEEWAEFIKMQCELVSAAACSCEWLDITSSADGGIPQRTRLCVPCHRCVLEEQQHELLQRHARYWIPWRGGDSVPRGYRVQNGAVEWADKTKLGCEFVFRRGFVERVQCRHDDWLRHGPAIVRQHPVQWVGLTDLIIASPYNAGVHTRFYFQLATIQDLPFRREITMDFPSRESAEEHLSATCITWARQQPREFTIPPAEGYTFQVGQRISQNVYGMAVPLDGSYKWIGPVIGRVVRIEGNTLYVDLRSQSDDLHPLGT